MAIAGQLVEEQAHVSVQSLPNSVLSILDQVQRVELLQNPTNEACIALQVVNDRSRHIKLSTNVAGQVS